MRPATHPIRIAAGALAMVAAMLAGAGQARAADADKPHPHQGKLTPYETLPEIQLDADQHSRLARGDLVTMTVEDEDGNGRGIAVIDIAAPPAVVWSRITGFEHYPEWVGPVKEAEVLERDGLTIHTRTKISGFLYKYEYFLVNTYRPDDGIMTWTLDYSRESDFDDCIGAWVVEAHPEREGWSRAWFSSDLKLHTPLPGFVMNWIKKEGLKDATEWVKRESEKAVAGEAETEPTAEEAPRLEWE